MIRFVDPRTPASRWLCVVSFTAVAVVIYSFYLKRFIVGLLEPGLSLDVTNKDFVNYWMASKLALEGELQLLFVHDSYYGRLRVLFGETLPIHSWSYPPHNLLLLWPLALMSYKAAFVVFLCATFVLFAAATALFRRTFAAEASVFFVAVALTGFALMMVTAAQNGFLTAALMLSGLAWMKSRPRLAGLAFALLTIKPQLGLLIPLVLVVDRNWVTLRWTAIFTLALGITSVVTFGPECWVDYFSQTLPYQTFVMTSWPGVFLDMMPTAFGGARALGFSAETAAWIQAPATVAGVAGTFYLLRREPDPLLRAFAVCAGTFLVSPYAFNYDMGALSVVAACMAGSRSNSQIDRLLYAFIAVLPAGVENLGDVGLPFSPLILAIALLSLIQSRPSQNVRRQGTCALPLISPECVRSRGGEVQHEGDRSANA